ADRSYGIHVAELAGVPNPVVRRANDVLAKLRAEKAIEAIGGNSEPVQAVFDLGSGTFTSDGAGAGATEEVAEAIDPEEATVLDALAELPVNELSPVEVLTRVTEWQERLERTDGGST
ncbi:MAG: DNA mismatch repair protein MutS, partial [Halanaeroarchaeum sp.]